MKTSTKWLIAILVGLVVVACIASLGLLALRTMSFDNWEYGMRSGRLWDDQPLLPRQFMPMRPFSGVTGSWVRCQARRLINDQQVFIFVDDSRDV